MGHHRGCGGAPQNGGVRTGARVPQGGERGRGPQGILCFWGAHQHRESDQNAAAPHRLGRCQKGKGEEPFLESPETHPRRKGPKPPHHRRTLPLSAGRAPRGSPRGPGHLSPAKGAERAAGATCPPRSVPGRCEPG